jgi:hypothetical protein
MNRRHAITPSDSFDRWRETNPGYVVGTPRRVRIPHRETGELVECVEIDGGKFADMVRMGREERR